MDKKKYGPTLPISEEMHSLKYRGQGETFYEAMTRIANALKDDDAHFYAMRDILLDMRFLPAGRIQAAIGSPRAVTPYNCFVSGTIKDSMDDIMLKASEAAQTMRMGGGIGYDFSTLRPRGDLIVSLDSRSSGPVSFMGIYDAVCGTIASAGHRRGAQMGVLRVDHPDIEEFIRAKQNSDKLTNFNISVGVTDEFMEAVRSGSSFTLRFNGRDYRKVHAPALFDEIMRSTWDWAEPGVLFIDRINQMNNLWYCEDIAATNPCAEQPLPPYGACLLGSFNLTRYIYSYHGVYCFDFLQFRLDIPIVVRAMDNVVDQAIYPLPQQEAEAKSKRRMGLGVTGLANAVEALGYGYGSPAFISFTTSILNTLRDEAYRASVQLAKEKGAFPLFDRERYSKGNFIQTLPRNLRDEIYHHGIRNSHLLSIAPTGTISLSADNISSGIEPVYLHQFERTIQTFDGPRKEVIQDYGVRTFGIKGKTTEECGIQDHLNVLIAASHRVDSAVSKTCNVPSDICWLDFMGVYFKAWEGGAKGCTTYRPGGRREGILNATPSSEENQGTACYIDPETGRKKCE